MGKSRIIDNDRGFRALKRQLIDGQDIAVKVGVLEKAGDYDPLKVARNRMAIADARQREFERVVAETPKVISPKAARAATAAARRSARWVAEEKKLKFTERPDVTVAQIAAWNEFGTRTIPARPAFRRAIDGNMQKIDAAISTLAAQVVDGKLTPDEMIGRLGLMGQGLVRREITVLDDPPNAPSTIKAKGSSNPLIDSGQLRRSVTYEVVRGSDARRARMEAAGGRGVGGGG